MKQDLINDGLHIAWGAWIAVLFGLSSPLAAVLVPLAVLPRELEQTYHALDDKDWQGLKDHVDKAWLMGKLRDLGGFAVGALAMAMYLNGG